MRNRDKTLLIVLSEAESEALREIIGPRGCGEEAGRSRSLHWIGNAVLRVMRGVRHLFNWKEKY